MSGGRTLEGLTTLEEFLAEEGVLEEVTERAAERVREMGAPGPWTLSIESNPIPRGCAGSSRVMPA